MVLSLLAVLAVLVLAFADIAAAAAAAANGVCGGGGGADILIYDQYNSMNYKNNGWMLLACDGMRCDAMRVSQSVCLLLSNLV
jgi:hypothetical protein